MPSTRSLLKAIESLNKATEMMRASWINKTRGLAHINLFLQDSMKKGILNIQLTKRSSTSNCKREQKTNSSWLDHRTERVLIIKTMSLLEAFSNQSSLVPFNGSVSMFFNLEDPPGINDIDTRFRRN
jgi:hypothetical protein